jgi:adenylosuccinate lyase
MPWQRLLSRREKLKMPEFNHNTYISPMTWRYGSEEMRYIWSEIHKRRLMRRVWVALAAAQHVAGLVAADQLADLEAHVDSVNIDRALQIERETRHDVMAEIRAYAEQCPVGGGIIHWGATSADITDNVDVLRQREAVQLVKEEMARLLRAFARRIEETAALPVMAYTHIQPAEPTTLGYRLAMYAQDLLEDYRQLKALLENLRGKGFKGAVGTQAAFAQMLQGTEMSADQLEALAMTRLDLPYFQITSQTYSRLQDLRLQQVLTGMAASLHKFALDFRLLQSPTIGELAEPFGKRQVGSSAMPFKRNPINAENLCSLARFVAAQAAVAWDNAAQTILERSLDDSANRRLFIPESFLAIDEMLRRATTLVEGMIIDREQISRNLARYGPFAATERVLVAAVANGADRQEVHEWLREASMVAWEAVQDEYENPLVALIAKDERMQPFLSGDQIISLMDAGEFIGTATSRAIALAAGIESEIKSHNA